MSNIKYQISNILFCGVIVGMLLASCGPTPTSSPTATSEGSTAEPSPTASPTPYKPELVICSSSRLDPAVLSTSYLGRVIGQMLWPPAAVYGEGYTAEADGLLTILPNEADDTLRRNEDGSLSVILYYRTDLVWSDGEPFKTADALLGLQLPPASSDPAFDVLEAQEGDAMVVFATLAPGAEYPYVPPVPPLPTHVVGKELSPEAQSYGPYAYLSGPSLGPYFVAEQSGDSLLLQANPYYTLAPLISTVRLRSIPEPAQLMPELESGGCDVVLDDSLSHDQLEAWAVAGAGGAVRGYYQPGPVWDYVAFNTYPGLFGRTPYFVDPRVRQAVAYAFDCPALAEQLWQGTASVADSWLPADHWAYSNAGSTQYAVDLGTAASLLEQAGWIDRDGDGVREYHGEGGEYSCQRGEWTIAGAEEEGEAVALAPVLLTTADALRAPIAEKLRSDLAQIGVDLKVQTLEPAAMFADDGPIVRRDFDMALLAAATRPDPIGINLWLGEDVFLHPINKEPVHRWELEDRWLKPDQMVERLAVSNVPSAENDYRGQNYSGWCNEQADLAVVQANLAFDFVTRQGFYAGQQVLFTSDVPVLPLFYRPRLAATASYVCGLKPGPYDVLTWNIAEWYFDPDKTCEVNE
ncbi:MAG: hypothetical protein JXB30_18580 [Anaerolineae bacterium]|nr:hypothetical protein [Anaerolineae bacterium]